MRKFRLIISFDADEYPECDADTILNYISKEVAPALANAYNAVPSYINTRVEVVHDRVVDDFPFD